MRQRLTFIVCGVPRSGTKALARGLNLHPNVLCASERLDYRADHSRVAFPDDLLARRRLMDRLDWRKVQAVETLAAGKPEIRFVGHKVPRYYLVLDRLNSEVPDLRSLVIYRSPYGFIPSWNRKEHAHGESRWLAGDIGLFGFLDLLVCLQNVARQPRAFLFPYDLGLNESVEPMLAALEFIGADSGRFDREAFFGKLIPKRRTNPRRIPLEPHEAEFLDRLHVDDLDALVERNWGEVTPSVATQIQAYLSSIRPALPAAIDEAFAQCDNPAASRYGAHYVATHRSELAELLEMTQGSEFVADLTRYGPARRLRHLFSQRRLLNRRLASIRVTEGPRP